MIPPIRFRAVRPSDREFLFRVYVSTRPDITLTNLTEPEKVKLLKSQYDAQHRHYEAYFSTADYLVVLRGAQAIGRFYVYRGSDEIRILDIALLPEFRSLGIGSIIMSDVIKEAAVADKPVRLYVEIESGALRFYERLDFVKVAEQGAHYFMECKPRRKIITA